MPYPRESERGYLYTRNIILMLFSVAAAFLLTFVFDNAVLYAVIEADLKETDAIITDIEENQYNSRILIVSYKFTRDDGSEGQGQYNLNTGFYDAPILNSTFGIVYSGLVPEYHAKASKHPDRIVSFYMGASSAMVILLSLFFVFRTGKQIQKLKDTDKYY